MAEINAADVITPVSTSWGEVHEQGHKIMQRGPTWCHMTAGTDAKPDCETRSIGGQANISWIQLQQCSRSTVRATLFITGGTVAPQIVQYYIISCWKADGWGCPTWHKDYLVFQWPVAQWGTLHEVRRRCQGRNPLLTHWHVNTPALHSVPQWNKYWLWRWLPVPRRLAGEGWHQTHWRKLITQEFVKTKKHF